MPALKGVHKFLDAYILLLSEFIIVSLYCGMKLVEKTIGWIVALTIGLFGPFDVFQGAIKVLWGEANLLFTIVRFVILSLLLIYQIKCYGIKILNRFSFCFFLLYSFYIFLYLTLFRGDVLDSVAREEIKVDVFLIKSFMILILMICAETIIKKFCVWKFVLLSVFLTILPSLIYIQIVGVDVLQKSRIARDNPDYLAVLTVGYCSAPLFAICLLNLKNLFKPKLVSIIITSLIIPATGYILVASGERGPIVWTIVCILICLFFKSKHVFKYFVISFFLMALLYVNIDYIINEIEFVAPKTAEKIYLTIYEGHTAGRFDPKASGGSLYGVAFNQFMSSPIFGSYYRIKKEFSYEFYGAYPHNIFLEIMITMGFIGLFPFIMLLRRAFKNAFLLLRRTKEIQYYACFIFFVSSFLELQTSKTVMLHTLFWLFLYMWSSADSLFFKKTVTSSF